MNMTGKFIVRICKEELVACFKVLSWHSLEETEENHNTFRIAYPRIKPGPF
jgi:hypothetical protein